MAISPKWIHVSAVVLIACLLWTSRAQVDRNAPSAADEPGWMTASAEAVHLVRTGASPSVWVVAFKNRGLASFGNQNPPVGKFYFGAAIAIAGWARPVNRWTWPQTFEAQRAAGRLPSLLRDVRMASVVAAGAVLFLTYLIAFALTANWAALIAPLCLYFLPIFDFDATHVYTDMPELALMLGSLVAMLAYLGRPRWGTLMLAGGLAGLACATKFSAFPILVPLIAMAARGPRAWTAPAAVAAMAAVMFVAVNPYLYPSPISRTRAMLDAWDDTNIAQQHDPVLAPRAVTTRGRAAFLVAARAFVRPELLGSQAPLEGALAVAWLAAILKVIGAIPFLWLAFRGHAAARALAIALAAQTVFTVFWLPFDRGRYYLPTVVLLLPLVSVGLNGVVMAGRWLTSRIGMRSLRS